MAKVALLVGVSDYRPDLKSLLESQNVAAVKRVLHFSESIFTEFKSLINFLDYGPDLNSLLGAQKDVEAMRRVLQHPDMGSFDEVKPLLNPQPLAIQKALETLCSDRQPDDLVLLYFSGLGVVDDSGKLYFVTATTDKNAQGKLVKSTAVSASLIHNIMSSSQSRQQVVILDCCFTKDFAQEEVANEDANVAIKNELSAERRVILTASTSTQYFFKHNESGRSTYTHYLVEGIETGAADLDEDGLISIKELHDYTSSKLQKVAPAIEPAVYVEEGSKLWLAYALINDPKLSYRKSVERNVSRSALDELRESLGLLLESATAIEDEVLKPYREYQIKLQYYAYFLEAIQHDLLSDDTQNEKAIERLQQLLGLTDKDITPIKYRGTQTAGVEAPEQVTGLPKVQTGGKDITLVKPLVKNNNRIFPKILPLTSKSEHSGTTLPVISSVVRMNISLNKTALLLIGAGLITGMALLGASYEYEQRQHSQLQKIKMLAEARDYENCLTQAQAVTQESSRYTDVQKLKKQCVAGVNWQNVQVETLSAHSDMVWSVVFSPDGQTLASGSEDETIKIWDVQTRKVIRTLSGHIGPIWSLAISPDKQTLASSSGDKTIQLWNLQTGKLLRILTAHSKSVWSVAISPDGQLLAGGSSDGTITLWDLGSGTLLRTITGHSGPDRSVTFSSDGQLLTSGSGDKTIKIWKFRTGELPRILSGHTSKVLSVAISPSGQTLASGSEDKTVRIWDLGNGSLVHTLSGHTSRVTSIALSPNGQTVASGSEDETIKIWNLQTGKLLRTLSGHVSPVISVTFSPDGQIASGGQSGRIKLWQRY